jgi:hypothetical protein
MNRIAVDISWLDMEEAIGDPLPMMLKRLRAAGIPVKGMLFFGGIERGVLYEWEDETGFHYTWRDDDDTLHRDREDDRREGIRRFVSRLSGWARDFLFHPLK